MGRGHGLQKHDMVPSMPAVGPEGVCDTLSAASQEKASLLIRVQDGQLEEGRSNGTKRESAVTMACSSKGRIRDASGKAQTFQSAASSVEVVHVQDITRALHNLDHPYYASNVTSAKGYSPADDDSLQTSTTSTRQVSYLCSGRGDGEVHPLTACNKASQPGHCGMRCGSTGGGRDNFALVDADWDSGRADPLSRGNGSHASSRTSKASAKVTKQAELGCPLLFSLPHANAVPEDPGVHQRTWMRHCKRSKDERSARKRSSTDSSGNKHSRHYRRRHRLRKSSGPQVLMLFAMSIAFSNNIKTFIGNC